MKISFLMAHPPPFVGGLQSVCLRVAQRMQQAGAEVSIIGLPDAGAPCAVRETDSQHVDGIQVISLAPGPVGRIVLRLARRMKKRRATFPLAKACYELALTRRLVRLCRGSSVLHYFGTGMEMNGYSASKAAKKINAQFVVEPAIHEGGWGDTWLDLPLYQGADLVLAHTKQEQRLLCAMGLPERSTMVIIHGIDFRHDGDCTRFRAKHQIEGPIVLFLGRKTAQKGAGRLLQAWPHVAEACPEANLVFVGGSKWKDASLEKLTSGNAEKLTTGADGCAGELAERNPKGEMSGAREATERQADSRSEIGDRSEEGPRILDLDDVTEEEKQDALAACDVMCLPSEGESFGMAYYEAWAYRKPVVALDLPALRETIGKVGGGLLTSKEPNSISAALLQLLASPELRRSIGEAGFSLAKEHDWDQAWFSYQQAYKIINRQRDIKRRKQNVGERKLDGWVRIPSGEVVAETLKGANPNREPTGLGWPRAKPSKGRR